MPRDEDSRAHEEKDSEEQFRMPGLACWLATHGLAHLEEHATRMCVNHRWDAAVTFDGEFIATALRTREVFGDASADGYAVLASSGPEELTREFGLTKDHAEFIFAVGQALLGAFGTPVPASEAHKVDGQKLADQAEAMRAADLLSRAEGPQAGHSGYGELVVLGYREYLVQNSTWHPCGTRNEKFVLARRDVPNGLRHGGSRLVSTQAAGGGGVKARGRFATHSVALALPEGDSVLVEDFVPDPSSDIFQIGRMAAPLNHFVVRGPLHEDATGMLCGPVSRFAARIQCNRLPPYESRLLAGGFNEENDLSLRRSTPKWRLPNGEWDAVTPFGIRVWQPEVREWREVSVKGDVYEVRKSLDQPPQRLVSLGEAVLTDGSIIDLAGVQLLYRASANLANARSVAPNRIVDEFNARRPQCPVQLHTICFEVDTAKHDAVSDDRLPYVFPACGHVHAYAPELKHNPCPLCRTPGPFVEFRLEWEPSICSRIPEVTLNPCGHILAEKTARHWAALPLPDNAPPSARYRPVCPYCAKPLASGGDTKPYSRIIVQEGNAEAKDGGCGGGGDRIGAKGSGAKDGA